MKTVQKQFWLFACVILFAGNTLYAKDGKIVFADPGWDSVRFHNAVAGFILNNVYALEWEQISGSTPVTYEALKNNDIDIYMELWTSLMPTYEADLQSGLFAEHGVNFDDNNQGLYIPRYVLEENPDLKSVQDLHKYVHLFPDADTPGKGRIYGAIPGWQVDKILYNKYKFYGLDTQYEYVRPGSDAAMSAAITSALDRKKPIVAYYWEPAWLLGLYDMVLLEDKPYTTEEEYRKGGTAFPSMPVTVCTSLECAKKHPEILPFLKKYRTSSKMTSQALAYIEKNNASYEETAIWFLKEHKELIDNWLNTAAAEKLKQVLGLTQNGSGNQEAKKAESSVRSFLYEFPLRIPLQLKAIDNAVRSFSVRHTNGFNAVRSFLGVLVNTVNRLLNFIPWFILLTLVFLGGWYITKKMRTGLVYALLLALIGFFGLWDLMNETLSIVMVSVIISLILGAPIGILLSASDRANKIMQPVLDTMQTMPVFVYLIPALLFFGLGKPPAVIATTIYAIVPMIRLTNLGIRELDTELVEASKAFGATKIQSLIKVEIPQALPTIMTGVNQTIMMAMSMVVTTSMIGAPGLGMEVLIGVNRIEIGRGLVSGTAVVIIAVVLDRITQGFIKSEGK